MKFYLKMYLISGKATPYVALAFPHIFIPYYLELNFVICNILIPQLDPPKTGYFNLKVI